MTISQILALISPKLAPDGSVLEKSPFDRLNDVSRKLSTKSKWNLSQNLTRCRKVAEDFEQQRIEIFKKHAPEGAQRITPSDAGWDAYRSEYEALLAVETDTKILHFEFADICRDDLDVESDLIAKLDSVLDNKPAEE